ncbi:MAG: C1 family peptidase, partial [Bacteroidota bacterium]|nr:C1 family peptidase [Bacteroidota bacterium]
GKSALTPNPSPAGEGSNVQSYTSGFRPDTTIGLAVGEMVDTMKLYEIRKNRRNFKSANSLDWSKYDDVARDQRKCGSCWVFSAVALIENISKQMSGKNGLPIGTIDLSEQDILSCNTIRSNGCQGGWPMWALNYAKKNGIPNESCLSYAQKDQSEGALCDSKCSSPTYNIKVSDLEDAMWNENMTSEDLRDILQDGPVVVAMYVPQSFFQYTGGIYHYNGGGYIWGHAVLLVGYDDYNRCFKARKSWGSSWGENGYFRISYDDVTNEVKFGSYAQRATGPYANSKPMNTAITIKNSGESTLIVSNILADKGWMQLKQSSANVAAGGSTDITYTIDWSLVGKKKDTAYVSIESDDVFNRLLKVRIIAHNDTGKAASSICATVPFYQDRMLPADTGRFSIDIINTAEGTMSYNVSSTDNWLHIDKPKGTGDNSVVIRVDKNSVNTQRTGTITIEATGAQTKTIQVRQGSNHSPQVGDISKTVKGTINFDRSDFVKAYSDADGDSLKVIRIEELPGRGTLYLSQNKVVPFQTIGVNDISKLQYKADTGTGIISFIYSGSDGANMSANKGNVVLDVLTGLPSPPTPLPQERGVNLSVYPNPNNGEFVVEINGVKDEVVDLSVLDVMGNVVESENIKVKSDGMIKFDLSRFEAGVYFINLTHYVSYKGDGSLQRIVKKVVLMK